MDFVAQLGIHDLEQTLRCHQDGLLVEMYVFVVVVVEDDEVIDQRTEDVHDLFLTEGDAVCLVLVVHIFEGVF